MHITCSECLYLRSSSNCWKYLWTSHTKIHGYWKYPWIWVVCRWIYPLCWSIILKYPWIRQVCRWIYPPCAKGGRKILLKCNISLWCHNAVLLLWINRICICWYFGAYNLSRMLKLETSHQLLKIFTHIIWSASRWICGYLSTLTTQKIHGYWNWK